MKTLYLIREVVLWIVCVIAFALAVLSIFHLKVLIVPVEYNYQDVDEMIHLIENYRMYYLYSSSYIKELEHTESTDSTNHCIDSLRKDYNHYKDSVLWDNEDYSTSVEYIYPKE